MSKSLIRQTTFSTLSPPMPRLTLCSESNDPKHLYSIYEELFAIETPIVKVDAFWYFIKCLSLLWDSIQPSLSILPPVNAQTVVDEFLNFA